MDGRRREGWTEDGSTDLLLYSSPKVVGAPQGPDRVRGPGEQPGKICLFLPKDVTVWCPFQSLSKDKSLLLAILSYPSLTTAAIACRRAH